MPVKQKFSTQVDPHLLSKTREIAEQEGRQLQSLIEEALRDLIEKKSSETPRPLVMSHYKASLAQYGALYERLAK
ncbi:MAG: hypothetical protein ACK4P3_08680 [Fimbriimonadaceae bacterium]